MNIRVVDVQRRDPQAHANSAARAAWMGGGLVPLSACDPRLPSRGRAAAADTFRRLEDRQFPEMGRAFEGQGGWVGGDEMARRMRRHWEQPISVLARWIVERRIVNIAWHSQILIPAFQFSSDDMRIRPVVSAALAELRDVFDDWEIAMWFAQPNAWLHEQRPTDLAARGDVIVIGAARTDRFIARG